MGTQNNNKSVTDESIAGENIDFSNITAVVTGWTLDFMFVSLCRRFKEGKLDEFNKTLSIFEAISQSSSLKELQEEKIMICAFLARVMYGKHLDVQFEEDALVMPLMSAFKIWSKLEYTTEDKSLFETITVLLLVQSVAVCMEKGQISSASSAIKWFENNNGFPRNLGVKLSAIVKKRDTYHPFLMSFSFSCLLETVQSFLDTYLEKNPSDYLLKEATKMIDSSQSVEPVVTQDSSVSEKAKESTEVKEKKENTVCLRAKRKLLSTKITDVWTPDTCKKPFVSVRRISVSELSEMTSKKSIATPQKKPKKRKPPQKWTSQLDRYLKDGVKRHGQGKWSRILLDYDFEGRSGTMLKDRWRVLMRAHEVD